MMDIAPRQPHRPLIWPDIVLDLQEFVADNPDEIFIVGGAVRDALLHRPLHDIDLATSGQATKLARKIANHFKGDFFILDADRDVGRALLNLPEGLVSLDVAHYRGTSLIDDLMDRDFTLNAMAADLKGDLGLLVDPLNGESDIQKHLLRRCTDHALSDDPIRALRAVRQSSQLSMHIETGTLRDIKASVAQLSSSSPERIRDEWFKLLSIPRPAAAIRIADRLGLLEVVIPETASLHDLKEHAYLIDAWQHTLLCIENLTSIFNVFSYTRTDQTAASFGLGMLAIQLDRFRSRLLKHLDTTWPNDRSHSSLLILAALLYNSGKVDQLENHEAKGAAYAGVRADALRLSVAEKSRLITLVRYQRFVYSLEDTTPLSIYHFWRKLNEAGVDICLLTLADYLATNGTRLKQNDWLMLVDRIRILLEAWYDKREQIVSPPTLVDGNMLMETLQIKPGPILGELLEQIRIAQVKGEVHNRDEALAYAQTYLRNKG
jgi:tRNA nucleotidyltransferase/poly(A) polymerase